MNHRFSIFTRLALVTTLTGLAYHAPAHAGSTDGGSHGVFQQAAAENVAPPSSPRTVVSGPLKRSDVLLSLIFFRPQWLQAFRDFHANRIVWTYGGERIVPLAAEQGVPVQCSVPFWVPREDPDKLEMSCVTKEGAPISLAAPTNVFPDINSTKWRSYVLDEMKKLVDAGCTSFQQDGPWLNYQQTVFRNGCYSDASRTAFQEFEKRGEPLDVADATLHPSVESNDADGEFEAFQQKATLDYHRWLHREVRDYARESGAPVSDIVFSGNFAFSILIQGRSDWLLPEFDFALSEAFGDRKTMPAVLRGIARETTAHTGISGVTFPTNDVWLVQRSIASAYALGLVTIAPWDVHLPKGQPRFFGSPDDFAPMFRMIRENAALFDDFESDSNFYRDRFGPVLPADDTVSKPGDPAPYLISVRTNVQEPRLKAVHVVSWSESPIPVSLYLRRSDFSYPPAALLTPDNPKPVKVEPRIVGDFYIYAIGSPLWAVLF